MPSNLYYKYNKLLISNLLVIFIYFDAVYVSLYARVFYKNNSVGFMPFRFYQLGEQTKIFLHLKKQTRNTNR